MAFRLLLYIARVLEKRIEGKTLYSKRPISIPWPEFFVLYNGKEEIPDEQVYRLSELFEKPEDIGLKEIAHPLLELEVKVLNINEGRNEAIVNRCRKLAEYTSFMARIHAYRDELGGLEEGIKEAIRYCHKHGILKEYLDIHGSEALNMILTEWNTEDAIAFGRKEAREEALEEGLAKGEEKKALDIARKMKNAGRSFSEIAEFTGLPAAIIEQIK